MAETRLSSVANDLVLATIAAINPKDLVKKHIRQIAGTKLNNCYVIAFGKAALPMSEGVADVLTDRITKTVVISPHDQNNLKKSSDANEVFLTAGHPVVDQDSVIAGRAIFEVLDKTQRGDLVIFLISGGGSSLVASPASRLSVSDLQSVARAFLTCGGTIQEFNVVRKHLDLAKGGGLLKHVHKEAISISLILSDVVGDDLSVIASGPTVPDPSTFAQAREVIGKYHLEKQVSTNVLEYLEKGIRHEVSESLKPEERSEGYSNILIGTNHLALSALSAKAQALGFSKKIVADPLLGEARNMGKKIGKMTTNLRNDSTKHLQCLVFGGETTVKVKGSGKGGRNQELVLAAVSEIAGIENVLVASFGTDGVDKIPEAAGAMATGETLQKAKDLGMDLEEFLENNDSYHFFKKVGGLIQTGPTGTNVNDVAFILVG